MNKKEAIEQLRALLEPGEVVTVEREKKLESYGMFALEKLREIYGEYMAPDEATYNTVLADREREAEIREAEIREANGGGQSLSARELAEKHGWKIPSEEQQAANFESNTGMHLDVEEKLESLTDEELREIYVRGANGTTAEERLRDVVTADRKREAEIRGQSDQWPPMRPMDEIPKDGSWVLVKEEETYAAVRSTEGGRWECRRGMLHTFENPVGWLPLSGTRAEQADQWPPMRPMSEAPRDEYVLLSRIGGHAFARWSSSRGCWLEDDGTSWGDAYLFGWWPLPEVKK